MKKLANNFHLTFEPDRLSLSSLLKFISENDSSSVQEIVTATGIPSGKSSGKVIPFLKYLSGMGLIEYSGTMDCLSFNITVLGNVVLEEDPLMTLNTTQWILHANMCNTIYGPDIWIAFFQNWKTFEVRDVGRFAKNNHIERKKFTPLLNMYLNENCFSYSNIIKRGEQSDHYTRTEAPLISEFLPVYSALCIYLMDSVFKNKTQISIIEFERDTNFSSIFGWDIEKQEQVYEKIASLGYIKINSLVSPKCIQPLISVDEAWKNIYMNVL